MTDSFLQSEEFRQNLKKIGPGSKFWYRSRFDPLTQKEYEMIYEFENREFENES